MLTKREQIAAMAMQGFIAGLYSGNNVGFSLEGTIVAAIQCADALLAELKRTETEAAQQAFEESKDGKL